jgi:pimeloyl-ACP methyl ester carboxylesterase
MRGFAGFAPSSQRRPGEFLKPMADELARYLRHRGEGPVSVVGHSMGGIVALILARDHPDLIHKLVVVDVPSFFSVLINPFATTQLISGLAEAARRRFLSRKAHELARELRASSARLVTRADDLETVVDWGLRSDQATVADVMAEVMTTDLRPDLKKMWTPTRVLYAWDRTSPMSASSLDQIYQSGYANLSSVKLLRIDGVRHYMMLDQPERFYAEIRNWLQDQTEARRGATGAR